jgi:hypothetical protein
MPAKKEAMAVLRELLEAGKDHTDHRQRLPSE